MKSSSQSDHSHDSALDPARRQLTVKAPTLHDLGKRLASCHGASIKKGLARSKKFYTRAVAKGPLLPDTLSVSAAATTTDTRTTRSATKARNRNPITAARWKEMAVLAREGARRCCPHAWPFFEGLSEGLGWDVFEALLDFELYTLETNRQKGAQKQRAATQAVLASAVATGSKVDIAEAKMALADCESSSDSSSSESDSDGDMDDDSSCDEEKNTRGIETRSRTPMLEGRCTGLAFAVAKGSEASSAAVVGQTVDLPLDLYGSRACVSA
jgi:hypothetical protein